MAQAKTCGVLIPADRDRWYLIRLVSERRIVTVDTCARSFGKGPLLVIGLKWQ